MPLIAYEPKNFHDDTQDVIAAANAICEEYAQQGYDLTLRQLYYQFVARGLINNTQKDYNRLGRIINDARMAGELDWDYIVDRTRNLVGNSHWETPSDILRSAAASYNLDKWEDQDCRVEVWVEKEALAGVIERVSARLDVDSFSCRGYVSQSEMWRAGQRLLEYVRGGQRVVVLHLGDHDPSGLDMTRDIRDRLFTFVGRHRAGDPPYGGTITRSQHESEVEVRRIALTWDQVQQYQPPPNPAKLTDSRASDYVAQYGNESWELDALDPATLADLIEDEITDIIDPVRYEAKVEQQTEERRLIKTMASDWERIRDVIIADEYDEEG